MAGRFIVTKLYRPPPHADLVQRPHLAARLDAGLRAGCKLTLLSAPAGFGKTTLLSAWAADLETPVAWLSLEAADNDLTRFWSYVAAALATLGVAPAEEIQGALAAHPSPPIEPLLTALINGLAESGTATVLVLDDFHVITHPEINESLTAFVNYLPPQAHLYIASRVDPSWPLARLRARGELTEVRTVDLRFSAEEARGFLNDALDLRLPPDAIATLLARTEGWAASLRMAALSLQERVDRAAFVRDFGASHRFVLDYLIEEVLSQQPPAVQTFLLETSVLDRLCGELCDAVTDRTDSRIRLDDLDRTNLFIVPLDEGRRWYRYHHLFAAMLRERLTRTRPEAVGTLHQRAGAWYEAAGFVPEALQHSLAAQDWPRAAHLVETNALAMLDHGELGTLARWLDTLPGDVVRARPWLCLARAWTLVYTGTPDEATPLIACAEEAAAAGDREGDEARRIAGHIGTIRAYQVAYRAHFAEAAALAGKALAQLPVEDASTRCFTALLCSAMLRRTGKLDEAADVLNRTLQASPLPPTSHTAALGTCNLGIVRLVQGRLREAETIFSAVRTRATQAALPPATLAMAHLGLAELYREWNQLQEAERLVRLGADRSERWGNIDMLSGAYYQLARVLQARGDSAAMDGAMAKAVALGREKLPHLLPTIEAERAHLLLASGDVAGALAWERTSGLHYDDAFPFQDRRTYITLALVLAAGGRLDEAEVLFDALVAMVAPTGAVADLIQCLAGRALVLDALGQAREALADLARSLQLAEPEGFVRTFLDLGPGIAHLLRRAGATGVAPTYVAGLLAAASSPSPAQAVTPAPVATTLRPPVAPLIEPLSDREQEVLLLLRSSLTAGEIADHLYVSTNTVRTHIRHIYEKLGVHRRLDAVARAEELGLF